MISVANGLDGATNWLAALPDWQAVAVLVGGSVVAAAVIHAAGDLLLRRVTARIPGEVDDVVLGNAHLAVWVTVLVAGPYLGLSRLGSLGGLADPLGAAALTTIALVWAFALARIGPAVMEAVTDRTYLDRKIVPIFQNVWTIVVASAALFVVLVVWEINVTPLLASAGVMGIVVGLAARDTIANFFGSIALYADGTYTVGDYVVLQSGERGRVEDVTIRSTVIRTRDDVLVTIPNSELNKAAIVNESAPRRHRRVKIPVTVAYGTDLDQVEELMLEIAEDTEMVRERPSPRVRLREFGESGLRITLLCWIDDPRLRGRARDNLMRQVYEAFRSAGVEIPFPQREVRLRDGADGEAVSAPVTTAEEPGYSATDGPGSKPS